MDEAFSQERSSELDSERYNPLMLEPYWQTIWQKDGIDLTSTPKPNQKRFYALSMFPYPSGNLHMGHVRNYVITDVIARMQRMRGAAVLHPMGWDAFGLPAENAAIERGIDPAEWTKENIAHMKSQLQRLGLSIDWSKEQATCDKSYYKWTQFIFLALYKAGLAYQKEATVNWDPVDKTVLANEQVDSEGKSWRSGAVVEKIKLKQWFLKITDYADELLEDLENLNGWPDKVKTMQANWIGRSKGLEIDFHSTNKKEHIVKVFTTRPETIYGVSYIVLAPENQLIEKIISDDLRSDLISFREKVAKLSNEERTSDKREKNGMYLGTEVINPATNLPIPVWTADYVLADYGTGAVMGVPAHDERDFLFAKKYNQVIKKVIVNPNEQESELWQGAGILINSGKYNGINNNKAKLEITKTAKLEKWGRSKTQYRLKDWLISRQRKWGCPIPILYCNTCGVIPVQKEDLPVEIPITPNKSSKQPNSKETVDPPSLTKCPKCGKNATRETDTMDTFMCSSWYYLRFADSHNKDKPFTKESIDEWLPVDQYVGGIEHAILHLLYSRFITKALHSQGLFRIDEPFKRLLTQGMVQGITYKNAETGGYVRTSDIADLSNPRDPISGKKLEIIYEKMSKSKYNGVDPSSVIDKYGADTARMFILFKAPPEKDLEWDIADVEGQYRFINRVWRLIHNYKSKSSTNVSLNTKSSSLIKQNKLSQEEKDLRRAVNIAIKSVTEDLDKGLQFNTAISELMKLTNTMQELLPKVNITIANDSISSLLKLLSPFAPHLADELWYKLGGKESVHTVDWPEHDENALSQDKFQLVIQIKGKVRGTINLKTDLTDDEIKTSVLNSEISKKWLEGKSPSRIILIRNKLVNLVP